MAVARTGECKRRARGECEWGDILVQGDVKGDMERLYAYCDNCPRIEELLKAYLAHASSSSRFLLLTYLQLYRVIPVSTFPLAVAPVRRYCGKRSTPPGRRG